MDKNNIAKNFSRNAVSYEDHAGIQKKCARKLIDTIKGKTFDHVLEIGCGTGYYTDLLRREFDNAKITAVDFSEDMVKVAREKFSHEDVSFVVGDGENIEIEQKADLITSNACFQWFENPEFSFSRFSKLLKENGTLCFSMYGKETFRELKEVLKTHFGNRRWLTSSNFPTPSGLETILKKHFKKFSLEEVFYDVEFTTLLNFLRDIKRSGTRGEGILGRAFLGKHVLRQLEKTYIERYKTIAVTHHVYFCKAKV